QNYIDASQFMIGFSFFEESASKGNLWFDVNEYDPNNPEKGKDIEGTRAKKYAEWQPSTGGLKAGIFSYAIDRDGVAHVPSTYKNRTS
ncbi:EndoS/ChiA family endoglycosidase, partial [Streptococcus pyogenes]